MTQELLELKIQGHDLLDRFCSEKDKTYDWAYKRLAKKLKVPVEKAHFATMSTPEAKRAIQALEKMLKPNIPTPPKKRKVPRPPESPSIPKHMRKTLKQAEIKAALAQLKRPKKLPWWRRLFR